MTHQQHPEKPQADIADLPGRNRGANMVTEARIVHAGGPGYRGSPYYQALLYLVILICLTLLIWVAWSWTTVINLIFGP